MMKGHSKPVELAWRALRHYLAHGEALPWSDEADSELAACAGVFVSIKKNGRLRGCIGTFEPTQPDIAREIIRNAVMAATVTDDGLGVIQSRYGTDGYVVDVEAKCTVGSGSVRRRR